MKNAVPTKRLSGTASRIIKGTGANAFGQAIVIVVQLLLVPTMASTWGIDQYGRWLLLFTIPSYLALGDLGFATAAGTKMTMEVAAGRTDEALQIFQSATAAVLVVSTIVGAFLAVTIFLLPSSLFSSEPSIAIEARWTLLVLAAYGLVCLQGSLLQAGYRSSGNYAIGTFLQACVLLAEGAIAMLMVKRGGSILEVAIGYLVTRCTFLAGQAWTLKLLVRWLSLGVKHSSRDNVRDLIRPALAVMALPTAQSLFLQGSAMILGITVSTAAVAIFTTVRTITRAGVQFTTLVNHALMPEAATAAALNQRLKLRKLFRLTVASSLIVTVPAATVLLLVGQQLVELWTAHAISPSYSLIAIMTAVMVVNGLWHPLSNLLLAINRQAAYSYIFLIAVLVALALGSALSRVFDEAGMAASILLLDLFMLQHVARHVRQTFAAPPGEPSDFHYPAHPKQ